VVNVEDSLNQGHYVVSAIANTDSYVKPRTGSAVGLTPYNYTTMAHSLTPREHEILALIVMEFSSCEIARQLELSVRTVETHRKNIYRKTQTSNLVGLIKYSIRMGLVEGFYFAPAASETETTSSVRALQHTA